MASQPKANVLLVDDQPANLVALEAVLQKNLSFLYGVIFTDVPEDTSHHNRNLCVFANAEVDRSPTGTGVAARLAVHSACARMSIRPKHATARAK